MTRGIQVPVTLGFDRHRAIGTLRVDADLLPPEGTYMFSIAGTVTVQTGSIFETEINTTHNMGAVSALYSIDNSEFTAGGNLAGRDAEPLQVGVVQLRASRDARCTLVASRSWPWPQSTSPSYDAVRSAHSDALLPCV